MSSMKVSRKRPGCFKPARLILLLRLTCPAGSLILKAPLILKQSSASQDGTFIHVPSAILARYYLIRRAYTPIYKESGTS
jgi:hypothetical protein